MKRSITQNKILLGKLYANGAINSDDYHIAILLLTRYPKDFYIRKAEHQTKEAAGKRRNNLEYGVKFITHP